jgi:ribosomal-protein-alanine N-acetyltransferase
MFRHKEPDIDTEGRVTPAGAPPMTLRALRASDLDTVMAIEKRCFTSHWSREALQNELTNSCAFYVVAESGGNVVGYAGEWIIMDEAHITTIAVDPEEHGKRFGERLLVAILQEARYRGAHRATLEVRVTNKVAQRLYFKYGFETVAIRRKYYQDTDEDALVMWVNDLFAPRVSALLTQRFGGAERDG